MPHYVINEVSYHMKTMLSEIINYVTTDIWRIRLKDHPRKKIFFITQLRVVILAFADFMKINVV